MLVQRNGGRRRNGNCAQVSWRQTRMDPPPALLYSTVPSYRRHVCPRHFRPVHFRPVHFRSAGWAAHCVARPGASGPQLDSPFPLLPWPSVRYAETTTTKHLRYTGTESVTSSTASSVPFRLLRLDASAAAFPSSGTAWRERPTYSAVPTAPSSSAWLAFKIGSSSPGRSSSASR